MASGTEDKKTMESESKVDNLGLMEQMLVGWRERVSPQAEVFETGKREVRQSTLFKNALGEVMSMFIPGGADFHARIRTSIEMLYVQTGELSVITDDQTLLIKAGQAHIFAPNVDHMIHAHTDTAVLVAVFPQAEGMVDDG